MTFKKQNDLMNYKIYEQQMKNKKRKYSYQLEDMDDIQLFKKFKHQSEFKNKSKKVTIKINKFLDQLVRPTLKKAKIGKNINLNK